jgi:hypothetical protein
MMTVSSSMTDQLCGLVNIGMLSTFSKAGALLSACAPPFAAAAAKLVAEPSVKAAAAPNAASLRITDLVMAFSPSCGV